MSGRASRAGVLVVGTGEAGVRVATTLRELGDDRPIVLCGDEPHPPYQRPPLSKAFLDGTAGHADLVLRTPEFFRDAGIEVRTGRRVTDVEVDGSGGGSAMCEGGDTVEFDQLVLATGARSRPLPVDGRDLDGVCALRGLDDAERLRERLITARRVVIVGGGYIGLEAAALASTRGLAVTIVEREDRVLSRVSADPLPAFLAERHREWGVEFEFGADVREIVGDGQRVQGVRLAGGRELPADLVLVGIGAVPETTLAEKLGLEVRRGIVVDAACRTSHPRVWAVGDCTVQPHPHLPGELIGVESVQNANDQARAAAAALAGIEPPRPPVPWFWSDQRDLKVQIAGISDGYDQYVVRGTSEPTVLYYRDGALIAAEAVNRPKDFLAAKRALAKGQTIAPEAAADPATPLKELITDRG
ncbi:NAD(P)/FAD-dependent oxidoreductase [Amycolatopsis thermophila]|uniref:3-phenylpropionate/trans-cinnamate dioxygenase ferredoxin reductase subunit n=1 Tax=Amycolatopsis thermophila TaxID=206084 RepID=A0ABU0EVZ6_9PSEU|nr:FAD-dependent oxidoreductase [Amycolatopsis thermophila]MDQ0379487.1 3-phenylpropionate/trans-cinnamate dioxygenase ferredoxin reductase subunit [Amycolatopsis thermophila]